MKLQSPSRVGSKKLAFPLRDLVISQNNLTHVGQLNRTPLVGFGTSATWYVEFALVVPLAAFCAVRSGSFSGHEKTPCESVYWFLHDSTVSRELNSRVWKPPNQRAGNKAGPGGGETRSILRFVRNPKKTNGKHSPLSLTTQARPHPRFL